MLELRDIIERALTAVGTDGEVAAAATTAATTAANMSHGHALAVATTAAAAAAAAAPPPPLRFYKTVLREMEDVGWHRIENLDHRFLNKFDMIIRDSANRVHRVFVRLAHDYPGGVGLADTGTAAATTITTSHGSAPRSYIECTADLPEPIQLPSLNEPLNRDPIILTEESEPPQLTTTGEEAPGGHLTLKDVYRHCKRHIERYDALWYVLDDFFEHCRVIEPVVRTFADSTIRIFVDRTCSIQVFLNVRDPRGTACGVQCFGPKAVTGPMMARFGIAMERSMWKAELLPRENLESMFEVSFPPPKSRKEKRVILSGVDTLRVGAEDQTAPSIVGSGSDTEEEEGDIACGICYTHRLDVGDGDGDGDHFPSVICENERCARMYHRSCLVEWLQEISTTTTIFNALLGACPYCDAKISVSKVGSNK